VETRLADGSLHPRDAKMKLAHEIVSIYHSQAEAEHAEKNFVRVFQQGALPDEMPEYQLKPGETVLDVLLAGKLVDSKSEGRRMLDQNGVRLDGEALKDPSQAFPHPGVLQVGKRRGVSVTAGGGAWVALGGFWRAFWVGLGRG
jgi:tyrosyl-tRNA synthetase